MTLAPGSSPAGGYLGLSLFGIAPIAGVGDDTEHTFTVPSFRFGGDIYTSLTMSSNGYLTVGGNPATSPVNQLLPQLGSPDGIIAPFWTNLDPTLGGSLRIGTLTDGSNTWIVLDWDHVRNASDTATNTFEVWLGIVADADPSEDITFVYDTVSGGDGGLLTVGAENTNGAFGDTRYFNGSGIAPTKGTQLRLSTSGEPNLAPEPGTWFSLVGGLSLAGLMKFRAKRSGC